MKYSGNPSEFSGQAEFTKAGQYEISVYAYDQATGNTGIDKIKITVY
ncbi:MAG: hypothetical protein HQK93_00690 [Nitrospirae bacterium]|nr:hypothetical protein [Nitrospirota bacterium]